MGGGCGQGEVERDNSLGGAAERELTTPLYKVSNGEKHAK